MTNTISLSSIEVILARWQDVVRLSDWDIRCMVVTRPWRKNGDIKIDASNRMATLMINSDHNPDHLEETVVHELLHIKLYGLDQMIEHLIDILYGEDDQDARKRLNYGFFMEQLETTTEDLTKTMLILAGRGEDLNFSRVEKQVQVELGE